MGYEVKGYEKGDKFIIEIENIFANTEIVLYKIKGFNTLVFDDRGLDRLEQIEEQEKKLMTSVEVYAALLKDYEVVSVEDERIVIVKHEDLETFNSIVKYLKR